MDETPSGAFGGRAAIAAGVFFLSSGVLSFEILSTRVLSVAVGNQGISAILGLAMLGFGVAATVVGTLSRERAAVLRDSWLPGLCALGSVSMAGVCAVAAHLSASSSLKIDRLLDAGGPELVASQLYGGMFLELFLLGALLSLPHFLCGVVVVLLFRCVRSDSYAPLYGMDLIGAAAGSLVCVFAMEYGGYRWPLSSTLALPVVAGFFLTRHRAVSWRLTLTFVLAMIQFFVFYPPVASLLEPRPNLRMLAGFPGPGETAVEEWHDWNSYARVADVAVKDGAGRLVRRFFTFGTGQGRAIFDRHVPYVVGEARSSGGDDRVDLAAALGVPRRALVLFAGVGSEVMALDRLSQGGTDITAVEINRQMLRRALTSREHGLSDFFSKPNIRLRVDEARSFLEQDESRYDLILAPYFGSAYSTLWASAVELAQYTFTREAYETMSSRLEPGGLLVSFDVNKVVLLANLRELFERSGLGEASRSVMIVSRAPLDERAFFRPDMKEAAHRSRDWGTPLDDAVLLFKPSGFSETETGRLRAFARERRLTILYDPGTKDEGNPYWQVLHAERWRDVLARLQKSGRVRFSPRTDDNPYLGWLYWRDLRELFAKRQVRRALGLFAAGAVLALAAVLWQGRRGFSGLDFLAFLFFAGTGSGFVLVEIGFIQKFGLFLGSPVYSMSISLASLLFFSGLGSLYCRGPRGAGTAALPRAALGTAVAVAGLLLLVSWRGAWILRFPQAWRMVFVAATLGPVGFFLGQVFPCGLVLFRRARPSWTVWAWLVSGSFAAGTVPLAVIMTQVLGIGSALWLGAGLYLALSILSRMLPW